jgi:Domain of unknown function DUF11/Beta-propeller repeat
VTAAVALLVIAGTMALSLGTRIATAGGGLSDSAGVSATPAKRTLSAFASLPLIFEENRGQTDPRVKFLAHGSGYGLFLTDDGAVLTLRRSKPDSPLATVLSMELQGANPKAQVVGDERLPGKSNYFIGNDPAKWHRDIPQFAQVRYSHIYPGVDLIYYGNRGQLEYDFEVAPATDAHAVQIRFLGSSDLALDPTGDLIVPVAGGDIRLHAPHIYQNVNGRKRDVQGRFELRSKHDVGFVVGDYDRTRTLVIDPILTYSTYLGGSGDEACSVILGTGTPLSGCPAVTVDSASNAYIAGPTTSVDFPTVAPYQSTKTGTANAFVAKFNTAANTLIFSTYLGGSATDYTAGVAIDQGFDVLVAGTTDSTNFPTTTAKPPAVQGAFQNTPQNPGADHVFVSELNPAGSTLIYSTYLSGNGVDKASGLAVDSIGNAYVTGTTTSTNTPPTFSFPATLGSVQTTSKATSQFFMTKVSPLVSGAASVPYSTYIGGSSPTTGETVGGGIAVDPSSNVYITGGTTFTDMPVLNAFQGVNNGGLDVFVTKINPTPTTGSQLQYSTYFGGSGDDIGYGVAADSTNAYVTGSTSSSTNFPASGTGVYQGTYGGGDSDAFLVKLTNPVTSGTTPGSVTLAYSTFIGGSGTDVGLAVAVDQIQGARLTGWTNSTNIPLLNNSIEPSPLPGNHAFVARIDTTATTPTAPGHYFTYLGGSGTDYGTGIAVDQQSASYVAGETSSSDFLKFAVPVSAPFQPNLNGATDAFLSKLGPLLSMFLSVPVISPQVVGVGNAVTFAYTITNTGDEASGVTFTDTLPSAGASFTSATVSSGSCGAATAGVVGCFIGTLNAGATATASVVLTPTANPTPSTTPIILGNSANVIVSGATVASNFGSITVNDYNISVTPNTVTVPAGVPATYTATITPTGQIPESVSLSCSSGLPTGATCSQQPPGPIPDFNTSSPVSTTLVINTTERVTTTTELRHPGLFYAAWLPIGGVVLCGVGIGGTRRRRWFMGMMLVAFLSLTFFLPGCSTKAPITTTSGTPAGTYVITVTATSGSATRNATVTLVVQ